MKHSRLLKSIPVTKPGFSYSTKAVRLLLLFTEIVVALFVLLFMYTAIAKLQDIPKFTYVLGESPLIGKSAHIIGWAIPITELALTTLLFIPQTRTIGLISSTILMALFTGYIIYMLRFADKIPCSCGGVVEQLSWRGHLLLNSLFVASGITSIIVRLRYKSFFAIKQEQPNTCIT